MFHHRRRNLVDLCLKWTRYHIVGSKVMIDKACFHLCFDFISYNTILQYYMKTKSSYGSISSDDSC